MSDKTNDEKLRILQERLSQIKRKEDTPVPLQYQREEVMEVDTPEVKVPTMKKKPLNLTWIKYPLIIGSVAFGIFYGYNNIDFKLFLPDLSSEEVTEKSVPVELKYSFNLEGDQLAIIGEFEDEGSAKAMANGLKVKGYKCNYFYLPNKSNSTKEIYKVFIGPYENDDETSQWTKNLETEFEIVQL
jgi:hypothetical protein